MIASGGPSANGSMRAIQLKRGGQLVTTIDLYDFIAKGGRNRKPKPLNFWRKIKLRRRIGYWGPARTR
mgnify:CR=1 FL=1